MQSYKDLIGGSPSETEIRSYLVDGNQKPDGGVYGQSITDACLGWDKTERMIYDLADIL